MLRTKRLAMGKCALDVSATWSSVWGLVLLVVMGIGVVYDASYYRVMVAMISFMSSKTGEIGKVLSLISRVR